MKTIMSLLIEFTGINREIGVVDGRLPSIILSDNGELITSVDDAFKELHSLLFTIDYNYMISCIRKTIVLSDKDIYIIHKISLPYSVNFITDKVEVTSLRDACNDRSELSKICKKFGMWT